MKRLLFFILLAASARADVPLSVDATGNQRFPLAAPFNDGVLFVWQEANGFRAGVWKPDQPIEKPLALDRYTDCVPAAAGETAVVFCASADSSNVTAFPVGGPAVTIERSPDVAPNGSMAAASNGSHFLLAWPRRGGIWRMTLDRDLRIVAGPAEVTPPSDFFPTPTVVSNGAGFLIAWQQYRILACYVFCLRGDDQVMVVATDGDGQPFAEPLLLSRGGTNVAAASNGDEYIVGWAAGVETLRRLSASGVPLRGDVQAGVPTSNGAYIAWSADRYFVLARDLAPLSWLGRFDRELVPRGSTFVPVPLTWTMVAFDDRVIVPYGINRIFVAAINASGRRRLAPR